MSLARREHALDLLVGQRHLLHGRRLPMGAAPGPGPSLACASALSVDIDGHRGRETGDAESDGYGANELTHGRLLGLGGALNVSGRSGYGF